MTELQQLIAIEEIKKLKARYFRYLDAKNWMQLRKTFTDDVILDYRGAATDPNGTNSVPTATEDKLIGVNAAIETISTALNGIATVHHGHMPEIDIVNATTATGIWAMFDLLKIPTGTKDSRMTGYGHYEETYTLTKEGWKISSLKLSRLSVELS